MDWLGAISLVISLFALIVAIRASNQSSKDSKAIKEATQKFNRSSLQVKLSSVVSSLSTLENDVVNYRTEIYRLQKEIEGNTLLQTQIALKDFLDEDKRRLENYKTKLKDAEDEIKRLTAEKLSINKELETLL